MPKNQKKHIIYEKKALSMKIYYSDSPIPEKVTQSIFLLGPSPRGQSESHWRLQAIEILKQLNFKGEVFVPIPEKKFHGGQGASSWTYLNQIDWECKFRHIADKLVFWVPRDIEGGLPGFTTNVEFGEDLSSGKIMYGRPEGADKCRYLDERTAPNRVYTDLKEMLTQAVASLNGGSVRVGGEIFVPLHIWNEIEFQQWYYSLKQNGNSLHHAQLLNQFLIPNGKLFSYTLKVKIFIKDEQRFKENEFVYFRKNISSVLAYYQEGDTTHIVLVKEFRSPVNNSHGYVYELPSGSSTTNVTPLENAQHELHEETGIFIKDSARFIHVGKRQMVSTLCAYTSELYKVQLSREEFQSIDCSQSFGVANDSERTSIVLVTLDNIVSYPVDYSTLGMIFCTLSKNH